MWPCIGLGAVGGAGRSSLHYDYITGAAGQPATLRLGLPAPGRLLPGNKINHFLVLIGLKRVWFTGCDPGGELPPAAGAAEQEILVGNSLRHPARPLLLLPGSDKNIYFCFFSSEKVALVYNLFTGLTVSSLLCFFNKEVQVIYLKQIFELG